MVTLRQILAEVKEAKIPTDGHPYKEWELNLEATAKAKLPDRNVWLFDYVGYLIVTHDFAYFTEDCVETDLIPWHLWEII